MRPLEVTSALESPLWFPAGKAMLFGVMTRPLEDAGGVGVILLTGGGATAPATNRNRLSVHLGRALARAGHHVLRFDYHGIGESTGELSGAPSVEEPFVDDVVAAIDALSSSGANRHVLIGSCFGARTALSVAPSVPGIEAVVLLSPPLRDVPMKEATGTRFGLSMSWKEALGRAIRLGALRGWLDPARRRTYVRFLRTKMSMSRRRLGGFVGGVGLHDDWVSESFVAPIRELAEREVPVLFVYGDGDWHHEDLLLAAERRLGDVLASAPRTEIAVLEGDVHGFTSVRVQGEVSQIVLEWIDRLIRPSASVAPAAEALTQDGELDARGAVR